MDKFLIRFEASYFIKLFFDIIFYGLHIMVGDTFDILYTLCASRIKMQIDIA